MGGSITVRPARVEDAGAMARMLVRSWRETYRGVMPDRVLDDPGLVEARERFWTTALVDPEHRSKRIAVAVLGGDPPGVDADAGGAEGAADGAIVGVAMAGPPSPPQPGWSRHLYILYVLAEHHGTGVAAALLDAVVDPEASVALWVADPNPRAQGFYRKHGFVADGAWQVDDGVREIRMVRAGGRQPGVES
jgi:GNAT superfamily N-acetyltransferase